MQAEAVAPRSFWRREKRERGVRGETREKRGRKRIATSEGSFVIRAIFLLIK